MSKVTSFGKTPISVCHPDGSYLNKPINTSYDNAEFNVTNAASDYDVSAEQSNAFSNVTTAHYVSIRTNYTITIKLNATTNNSITVTSSDSPFVIDTLEVTNIYISNASGSTAAVKVYLT